MSNYDKPQRKRYIPPSNGQIGRTITITKDVAVSDVIASALSIIKVQVDTLASRSNMGGTLNTDEVKNLRTYVQSLVELSREDRERDKQDGVAEFLKNMKLEDLVKLAQGQLGELVKDSEALDTTVNSTETLPERSNEVD